ncbi:overexpressed in colon carcinoma 1 protein [Engraulis encrasicolus]|uniref:overexpressed in colon carcinoma 1 protein n=1 Tax=Engraulis encrasicolus TaxID=184585 RepID=UPI002FCF7D69
MVMGSWCLCGVVWCARLEGPAEASKDVAEDLSPDEEKRRNYGGVYVGLPADLTAVASSQSKSTRKD